MGARLDYSVGGDAGYTGGDSAWPRSFDDYARTVLNKVGDGVNRLLDVEVDRVISARRATPTPPPPGSTATSSAGLKLPTWAPLAALGVGALLVLIPLLRKG